MRKKMFVLIACSLICLGTYRWGNAKWEQAKLTAMEYLYREVTQLFVPSVYLYEKQGEALVYEDIERLFLPVLAKLRVVKEPGISVDDIGQDDDNGQYIPENNSASEHSEESVPTNSAPSIFVPADQKKVVINRTKLEDFDYLRQNFYQIDNTTTIGSDQLEVGLLLGKDMTIKTAVDGPQILIYHTHSQEGYKDSIPGDASMTVVGIGDYLEKLLEENYGIEVLHHKGQYDVPDRDSAYSKALPELEKILKENPTIEVVIDLHRDGVPETAHFVTEINGKPTAQIMFFNGLSRTTSQGNLSYLPNAYLADNLALSFQMQLTAAEYYPGFTRRIYLRGYRYNMHLCPKSMLVEVGAQTNTFAEARNAMEPLADMLFKVLLQK